MRQRRAEVIERWVSDILVVHDVVQRRDARIVWMYHRWLADMHQQTSLKITDSFSFSLLTNLYCSFR